MTKQKYMATLVATAMLLLSGCQTMGAAKKQDVTSDEQRMSLVIQQINDSTELAVTAQQELAMTADAKAQQKIAQRQRLLTDVVSYDFYGDVEDILKQIAMKYGYAFNAYGKAPPQRVVANVYVTKKPVLEVLKQIGYTSTEFLDVAVTRDAIELRYKAK